MISPFLTGHIVSALVEWDLGWIIGLEFSHSLGDIRMDHAKGFLMLISLVVIVFISLTTLWHENPSVFQPFIEYGHISVCWDRDTQDIQIQFMLLNVALGAWNKFVKGFHLNLKLERNTKVKWRWAYFLMPATNSWWIIRYLEEKGIMGFILSSWKGDDGYKCDDTQVQIWACWNKGFETNWIGLVLDSIGSS
ncbi:hypothetical protein L1987_74197 [Smallanthus sonchifolius]|uniref:Uncharacterized protein n=1 Tax=Smallanthus sonchifolius TaxID=185202 RepID=A0ACB9A2P1_9ASTR|nr:hypothetical protein L1987_74197 [Smallanthus sonchifolius]